MNIEQLEISWSVGGRRYSLFLDAAGAPHLEAPNAERPDGRSDGGRPDAPRPDEAQPAAAPPGRAAPPRKGRPWSEEEEEQVRDGFLSGETATALAKETGRTRGAVLSRLVRLGLLTEEEAGLRYPVGKGEVSRETVGRERAERGAVGREPVGREPVGREPVGGVEPAGQAAAISGGEGPRPHP